MNYREAIEYIERREKFGVNLGLLRVEAILSQLGDPHKKYDCIHVAGTNGKGSAVAMLSAILTNAGLRVGAYTSPHLLEYTERIRVNDADISKSDFARAIFAVKGAILRLKFPAVSGPTVFEVITAAAFYHFARVGVKIAILEVGLGGRLDATNVVDPLVSVIMNVDYDHTEVLGGTLRKIAREKAGIVKPGVPVVTAAGGAALKTIKRICKTVGTRLVPVRGKSKIPAPLIGEHQKVNLTIVLAVLRILRNNGIKVGSREIRGGLKRTRWRGRFEIVSKEPLVILDGAHNPAGAKALRGTLNEFKIKRPLTMVLGILANKDVNGIVHNLAPIADSIIATKSSHLNAALPSYIARVAGKYVSNVRAEQNVRDAIKAACCGGRGRTTVITGSLFTVADALKSLD